MPNRPATARTTRSAGAALALVVVLVVGSACWGGGSTAATKVAKAAPNGATSAAKKTRAHRDLLFASRGTGTVAGTRLSLTLDPRTVTWITDRPDRRAGHIDPSRLVGAWAGSGFAQDPPNAVLLTSSASTGVELTDPAWDAATGALGFTLAPLDGAALPTGDLRSTELFIDDVCGEVGGRHVDLGGCTDSSPRPTGGPA